MRCAVLVAFACGCATLAGAPVPKSVEQRDVYPTVVGTKWEYESAKGEDRDTEYLAEVKVGADLTTLVVRDGNGTEPGLLRQQLLTSATHIYWLHQGGKIDPPLCVLMLPHKDKQSWKVESEYGGAKLVGTLTAFGPERVKVPAGTFDAIRVEAEYKLDDKPMKRTWWFAPGVGLVRDKSATTERVLKSFTLGKK